MRIFARLELRNQALRHSTFESFDLVIFVSHTLRSTFWSCKLKSPSFRQMLIKRFSRNKDFTEQLKSLGRTRCEIRLLEMELLFTYVLYYFRSLGYVSQHMLPRKRTRISNFDANFLKKNGKPKLKLISRAHTWLTVLDLQHQLSIRRRFEQTKLLSDPLKQKKFQLWSSQKGGY